MELWYSHAIDYIGYDLSREKASFALHEGGRNLIFSSTPSPRANRWITWTMHWTNCRPLDESTPGIILKSCVQREKGEKGEKGHQKAISTIANFSTSRPYFRSRTVYFVRDYGMYLFYLQPCSEPQFTIYAYNITDYIKFPLLFTRMLNHITAAMTLLTKNHL